MSQDVPISIERMTMAALVAKHGLGISITSDAPEIKGVEVWSQIRVQSGTDGFGRAIETHYRGVLWRSNDGKNDGRSCGEHGMVGALFGTPIWRFKDT